jgi:hypothetical protein
MEESLLAVVSDADWLHLTVLLLLLLLLLPPPPPLLAAAAAALSDPTSRIAWRCGMVRPAADVRQSQQYWKLFEHHTRQPHQHQQQQQQQHLPPGHQPLSAAQAMLSAALIDSSMAQRLVPGLQLPVLPAPGADGPSSAQHTMMMPSAAQQPQQHQGSRRPRSPAGWSPEQAAALHIPGGITVQPLLYMQVRDACWWVSAWPQQPMMPDKAA